MLFHSGQGSGRLFRSKITSVSLVASDGTTGSTSVTIPSASKIGDIAIIFGVGVAGTSYPSVSGWTLISGTYGGLFALRIFYKKIQSSDIGASITLNNSSSVDSYGATNVHVFRANSTPMNVYISSLNADGETNNTVSRTKDTSVYSPPNIIIAAKSDFNTYYPTYSSAISGSYWTGGIAKTAPISALASSYEIQNASNINRTVSPTNSSSSAYQHMHSFVINMS